MKTKTKKKSAARGRGHARQRATRQANPYQQNPYAPPRNAGESERTEVVVPVRQRLRQVARRARAVGEKYPVVAGLAAGGMAGLTSVAAAAGAGWLAGKGWSPPAVAGVTAAAGLVGSALLPPSLRGIALGVTGLGSGMFVLYEMQKHAAKQLAEKIADAGKAADLAASAKQQQQPQLNTSAAPCLPCAHPQEMSARPPPRALPDPTMSSSTGPQAPAEPVMTTAAYRGYMPSGGASALRTYGSYGRADDQERMAFDPDLELASIE